MDLESGDECVIREGRARGLEDAARTRETGAADAAAYHWDLQAEPGELFEVPPRVVFGWLCDGSGRDGDALFSQTATRWRFGGSQDPAS